MKSVVISSMKLLSGMLLITLAVALACGQGAGTVGKLDIDRLDRLSAKAAEIVSVNLDERLLRIVPKALSKDPDDEKVRKIIADLKGVYVKSFDFDAEGAYGEADVGPIRQQLRSPGWSRIIEVTSRREGKNVEVYILTNGGRIDAMAVLAFEPKQLTVVNIVGTVDLEKLSKLEGQFGIPDLELEQNTRTQKK